eukprot:1559258-Karenia_brevis.AAC.1
MLLPRNVLSAEKLEVDGNHQQIYADLNGKNEEQATPDSPILGYVRLDKKLEILQTTNHNDAKNVLE